MKKVFLAMGLLVGMAGAEVNLEVNGVRVVGDGYKAKADAGNAELRPFNWTKGTSLSLLLTTKDLSIVGLNEKESKLTVLADDQGTDFMKVKSRFSRNPYKFGWISVSQDGKALGTTVETEGTPAKGARQLVVKGELVVTTGSTFEKEQSGTVPVKEGTKVEVGGYKFKISEVNKPKFGDAKLSITLETNQDMDRLKGISFFDESGKELEADPSGSSSMGFGAKMTYTRTYQLKKKVDEIEVGVLKWTDLKDVKVPVDLSVGVGL